MSERALLYETNREQRLWHCRLAPLCCKCPQVVLKSINFELHYDLLSTGRLELVPGSPLQVFLEATAGLSPGERAERLENDAEIVRVHDEAAREGQTAAPNLEDQVCSSLLAEELV